MNISVSTLTDSPELTVNRTDYPADDDYAVQVFLADSFSSIYLMDDEARTLAKRLLAATDDDTTPEGTD